MLSAVLLLALAAPTADPAPAAPAAPRFVILGNETQRARLEQLLGFRFGEEAARSGRGDGMNYVSCIGAWRGNPEQTAACVRARMPRDAARPIVVISTYDQADGNSGPQIRCVGRGGDGQGRIETRAAALSLRDCVDHALRPSRPLRPTPVRISYDDRFDTLDATKARAEATRIVVVAVDHVGIPRGATGRCLVSGRIERGERGPRLVPGAEIGFSVPCSASIRIAADRRVHMGEMDAGTFGRVWIGPRGELLDYERMR